MANNNNNIAQLPHTNTQKSMANPAVCQQQDWPANPIGFNEANYLLADLSFEINLDLLLIDTKLIFGLIYCHSICVNCPRLNILYHRKINKSEIHNG